MKKFLIYLATVALFMTQFSFSVPVSAKEVVKKPFESLKVNYEKDLGHEGRTKDEIINELLNDGLSYEDAEYYAKMDILVHQIEEQNIDISINESDKLSNAYIKSNGKNLRNQALNLDKRAFVAMVEQNDAFLKGHKDVQKVKKFNEEHSISLNSPVQVIEINYPDGSKVVMEGSTVEEQVTDKVETQTWLTGPWTAETRINDGSDGFNDDDGGTYTTRTTWRFVAGSYASVQDVLRWKFGGKSDLTIDYISDEGSASYAGVVTIRNIDKENYKTGYSSEREHILQGYTDAEFAVSGAFSATFGVLSVDVEAGAGWSQFAISEIVRFNTTNNGSIMIFYTAGTYF
ncbi:hypothetical protein CD30_19410 [Ureibacillus massiliensis 4400831 = CIP 108448 = CCUG 49529]|uniref:SLH domain-containing protein n=1 Tax=Ureibacillus massiliensis 4400831 = CIP 108448 = CCUG 49529 TaxID=1211035 RepID=A0A0A3IL15_9BACL|nr:hypothetical protein [Ureibacillus massiliensis]KGR83518.1 hypothetical protein CD30_19410 [Ureibacillus massiliensis 4400831 = CIP 108448 = CCUG 49529]